MKSELNGDDDVRFGGSSFTHMTLFKGITIHGY